MRIKMSQEEENFDIDDLDLGEDDEDIDAD